MEFTNEIFFNKNLKRNETVLITYSGKLYREHSAEVTIVYGFGKNWEYTQEKKMIETENGFEVSIELKNYDTFNFCFRNNYNIWDNNFGFNYISAIEELNQAEETSISENQNIENTINTIENNSDVDLSLNVDEKFEESFSELIDSILKFDEPEKAEINLENGFGLQAIDEEINLTDYDDIFQELYNDITNLDEEDKIDENETATSKLENLLSDFSEKQKEQQQRNQSLSVSELDEMMDNILNSIADEDIKENTVKNINIENSNYSEFKISELPVEQKDSEDFLDKVIDNSYNFFQKIWFGCKKVGSLIKQKAKSLLGEE